MYTDIIEHLNEEKVALQKQIQELTKKKMEVVLNEAKKLATNMDRKPPS